MGCAYVCIGTAVQATVNTSMESCLKDSMVIAKYAMVSGANCREGTHCQLD